MAGISLRQLPDRTPVKLAINLMPDLHATIGEYAAFYHEQYGREESVADLIPAMLAAFLDNDRVFQRLRRERRGTGG
ncbi:DUF2274 domain-containing protein [Sphingopyxis sp. PAMC25046]|uniref:DUF2274 domain-containing protein n=1 Tax=Sphingopyxis sp. PAMC25046 TaxID=2565556 RepID=UPI00109DB776|nr:DUF2274 domain-containing protein [Sphingopyxis sp. PAMC25046]QCB54435.1 DUF2274 domain-containing protein [Sphingopyxis sp. PAMC25046]